MKVNFTIIILILTIMISTSIYAEDNNLEIIKVINENGSIKSGFGEFSGLSVLEARKLIVDKIKEEGLLEIGRASCRERV